MIQDKFNLFFSGHCLDAYHFFGAHRNRESGKTEFTVWAPHAKSVRVIGAFNYWDREASYLAKIDDRGVWSLTLDNVSEWDIYRYVIEDWKGKLTEKSDPFAFYSELRPSTSSKVVHLEGYNWEDQEWMQNRSINYDRPMNIYEVHAGSWKIKENGEHYTYAELADELIPYCVENGYTHIELMPLNEYPFDGSWGYQASGYFSLTSRYGSMHQFMYFMDKAHKNNIGVIMDFVPVHFVKDNHGLRMFDGTPQFEYQQYSESEWGTCYFDLAKEEVRSFLMSSAAFWCDVYHMDGIRVDAVSNLIFWKGNKNNGVNTGAVDFIKRLNYDVKDKFHNVMMIAEDSSDYEGVTKPSIYGGLGFDYKWDLGWMNDTLKYYAMDPVYRKYHHNMINFSMAYFYSEKFIMEFSHDEVVHGKATIVNKMWGLYNDKFAQARNLYLHMYTHRGMKINFMGKEIGLFRVWDENTQNDWFLLQYPVHDCFRRYLHDLSKIYLSHSCLYKYDYSWEGFKWIDADNAEQSIYTYYREDEESIMVVVLNMTPVSHEKFEVKVPMKGYYTEVINSDKDIYGGYNMCNYKPVKSVHKKQKDIIRIRVAPFAGILFEIKK